MKNRRVRSWLLTVAAGAAALLLAVGVADAVSIITEYPVAVTCTSTGQACDQTYQKTVTTSSQLKLEFQSAFDGCASFGVGFYVDGTLVFSSPALGLLESTGTFDAGPATPGSHALEVRATGVAGGCDDGTLHSWGGRFTVSTNDDSTSPTPPPAAPTSPDQCKKGGWRSFTALAFKNQGQCVSFVVHQP
jgi:hypothetical protein